ASALWKSARHIDRWYPVASGCFATYASHASAGTALETATLASCSDRPTASMVLPVIRQRQSHRVVSKARGRHAGDERLDGAELEVAQQREQPRLGLLEMPVMTEPADGAHLQPRLAWIDFPRVEIEHHGAAFDSVDARDAPPRPPVRQDA